MKVQLEYISNNFLVQILVVIVAFEIGFLFTTRLWANHKVENVNITPTISPAPTTEEISSEPTLNVSPTIEASPSARPTLTSIPSPTIEISPSETPTQNQ